MAENENGQEQTEQPTAKRLREAREKGQVARSREFNTLVILIAGGVFLLFLGGDLAGGLSALLTDALTLERSLIYDPGLLLPYLRDLMTRALLIVAPLFVVMMTIAILGPILIGGANFSAKAFAPKFSKLNPITGIKRVFSVQGLMELVKSLGKFVLVGLVAGLAISGIWESLMHLGELPVEVAITRTGEMAVNLFLIASAALLLVAAIDVPFQLYNHNKQLKMTLQEIKDEFKESDGKPEVKGRIRQMQMEMSRRRMMSEVPNADVIITNPTHYAVAIAYAAATMRAPHLLAKGADDVAAAIRELAETHDIPRIEAPRVARAIYFTTEIGQEIPNGLFVAVARLLAYVYQLKREDPEVEMPDDLPVPEEYLDPRVSRQARREAR
ncbi:flagellar biosynthesis protein FlhB [Thiocystis violascens]|uniref:Flagellar biosynthetic protein FlhB n=1 Tax=Thiocystis violascens (strain ATCC 17096 / DSM 198 / 6111) TaxID=765911 RepID=U3GJL3_THIV6|nr:flagellar biosynthesis protein FlhB [Thiocystis violascens]AFL72440.1 flagellar biosynthetic protein FlhB [Thiocystis violascens DSM 198]